MDNSSAASDKGSPAAWPPRQAPHHPPPQLAATDPSVKWHPDYQAHQLVPQHFVYTVACIYTSKETTFDEVMCVVPKVWKRLMVTFAWNLIVVLAYNMVAFLVLLPWLGSVGPSTTGLVILCLVLVIYMMGFVYISIIWHLASVVSVLEDDCGIEAMFKSKALVKGKMIISIAIFVFLNLCFILIQLACQKFVVVGESLWSRIGRNYSATTTNAFSSSSKKPYEDVVLSGGGNKNFGGMLTWRCLMRS
ncbi:hypothetical protein BUALT_Bualt04G0055600 [Buddleja alternifolia]|uniref:Uncharacterized protein n=1 Tax=Buddleja alternifolia TaxID=168488 RepID=A0AAV6XQY9_9LAMI|nr:hypothetical protein BUALT_Bualt04G0055600 [Buddleja alternifolia]